MQNIYDEMVDAGLVDELVNTSEYFPNLQEIENMVKPQQDSGGSLIIFDDTMVNISAEFEQLFCNVGHHFNTSIIFITQNLFYKNTPFRTMSLNTHYFVIMKNERDKQQISILAKQVSPYNSAYIVQAYKAATSKPYDYLILDFTPDTPPIVRVRSKIFAKQFPTSVYIEL